MPLHPQAGALLDELAAAAAPPLHTLAPPDARRMTAARNRPLVPPAPVARVEDRLIPGPGGEIPVRIYTPAGRGPFPVLVWFHGGGWVIGSLDESDFTCRALANAAGCMVVSVDYRLAPEHPFPAAPEDAHAAVRWTAGQIAGLGGDPALVITAGYDPLRDEGEAYAARLEAAGNTVTLARYDDMIHAFYTKSDRIDRAKEAIALSAAHLRAAYSGSQPPR